MNKKSSEYKEINKFLSSFNIIQHSQGSTVLASQDNTYLIRNIDISNSDEHEKQHQLNEIVRTLSTHQSFNCKNILPLVNFDIIFNKTKTQSQIRAIYNYGRKPLSKQIEERKDSDQHFDQDALWSLLFSLASPLSYLQQKSIIYGVLDSSRVFLDNDTIAIMDPSSTGVDPYEIMTNRLYSPQLINSQSNYDQINMFKSDVFVLGLLMLQCGLLKMELYDYDENILQICFTQIKDLYSQEFCQFIESMLHFDPQQRPSFQQILAQVNEMFEISTNDMRKLQPITPDQEDEPNQLIQMQEYSEKQNIDILQTQYIRFQDHHQNNTSFQLQKSQLKFFYPSNSQFSQSPINESSEFSQNSSLFIEDSMVKSFQKSKRLYKPKQIKQKLINKDHQFHTSHYENLNNFHQNTNNSHRRSKTDFQPNFQKNFHQKSNQNFNDIKIKQSKQNQPHHNFSSRAVFSPLNKENLFTKPEIMNMIKHDIKRIEERKKKFLSVNFSYIPESKQKNTHEVVKNEKNDQKISSNHKKVQSFHQASINYNQR